MLNAVKNIILYNCDQLPNTKLADVDEAVVRW